MCGRHVDEGLYKRVIAACGLDHDIATFSRGDATIVGERGATLSGGQKSRLAFARACYRNADVYLLDSVVASLDTVTSAAIVQEYSSRQKRASSWSTRTRSLAGQTSCASSNVAACVFLET